MIAWVSLGEGPGCSGHGGVRRHQHRSTSYGGHITPVSIQQLVQRSIHGQQQVAEVEASRTQPELLPVDGQYVVPVTTQQVHRMRVPMGRYTRQQVQRVKRRPTSYPESVQQRLIEDTRQSRPATTTFDGRQAV